MNNLFYHKKKINKNKELLRRLKEFGCTICGYSKSVAAIDFHHVTENKKFELGDVRHCSFKKLADEVNKCIRVCANCHREIHAGLISEEKVLKAYKKQAKYGNGQMELFDIQ